MESKRVTSTVKAEILDLIKEGKKSGVDISRCCELLQIPRVRVNRWKHRKSLNDAKPGPLHAPHALLQEEKDAILAMAKDEMYINESHRVLRARGADQNLFHVSETTVFRVMKESAMTTPRVQNGTKNRRSAKPDRNVLTGPNQRWCWDITYLPTPKKGVFLYLFVLLDEYSRKIISWRVSYHMKYKEAMELLQEGIEKEGLDTVDVTLPDLINDRGSQMKAKPFVAMCKELGIEQKFSRPRTPNDNPFIESFFSTFKSHHTYPEVFMDDIAAITHCTEYFSYYCNDRLHGGIDFVTPNQMHCGKARQIVEKRILAHAEARRRRIYQNNLSLKSKTTNREVVAI